MEKYTGLKYISNNKALIEGCPRVYFCCHPEDFDECFPVITKDIFKMQENAVVWYIDPLADISSVDDLLEDIEKMQLVVIPITGNFLYKDNRARTIEFKHALENNIPILPILVEDNLENDFNSICGNLHCLNKYSNDDTALTYEEKLKKFVNSVLAEEELLEKIREAFDAYIFLSYRKKDRKYANMIMKLIHENEFCRDIAIWYDEYLTPGENFNEAITNAMKKSSLFALVVTPNILEDDNYVMRIEYPSAVKAGMDIVPIEAVETKKKELKDLYPLIGDSISVDDREKIASRIERIINRAVLDEKKSTPEHLFFIGLAYLKGIDVEINAERAISLIKKAASMKLPEAMDKMATIYRYGEGIKPNLILAVEYQKQYVEVLEEKNDSFLGYEKRQLANMLADLGRYDEAEDVLLSVANKKRDEITGADDYITRFDYAMYLIPVAELCERRNEYDRALIYYNECINTFKQVHSSDIEIDLTKEIAIYEKRRGKILLEKEHIEAAFECLYESMKMFRIQYDKDNSFETKIRLLDVLCDCGNIKSRCGQILEAKKYIEEALTINKEFIYEDGNRRFYFNHIRLLVQYLNIEWKLNDYPEIIRYYKEEADIINKATQKAVHKEELKLLIMLYFIFDNVFKLQGNDEEVKIIRSKILDVINNYFEYHGHDDEMVVAAYNEYSK